MLKIEKDSTFNNYLKIETERIRRKASHNVLTLHSARRLPRRTRKSSDLKSKENEESSDQKKLQMDGSK